MKWFKRPKYGNRKTEYRGRLYDSKREADYAARLDLLRAAGEVKSWEPQVKYEFVVNGVKIGTYTADFVVQYPDGRTEVVDAKGYADQAWPRTKKLMLACHGIEVKEV